GNLVELDAVGGDSTRAWWRDAASGLPSEDDGGGDRWTHRGNRQAYSVLARYDTSGEIAHVSIADSAKREWPVAQVLAAVYRIDWLDRPASGDDARHALTRAFSQAAAYDRATRVAAARALSQRVVRFASLRRRPIALHLGTSHATYQSRERKSARNVR